MFGAHTVHQIQYLAVNAWNIEWSVSHLDSFSARLFQDLDYVISQGCWAWHRVGLRCGICPKGPQAVLGEVVVISMGIANGVSVSRLDGI